MSLREYQRKRDFSVTAEPGPKAKARKKGGDSFVVQKHDASRLHYDFRLEMAGVLASWAVPKGFPMARGERHLAVHVEDHPLDYAGFEGIIPKGQYGGGTVMVWDVGTYELLGGEPVTAVKEGKLHLMLHGEKLKGEWTLVQGHRTEDEKNWFLIKTGDGNKPITKKQEEHSVVTGRTLKQIAAEKSAVWNSNRGLAADERAKKAKGKPAAASKSVAAKPKGKKALVAKWLELMKATLMKQPPIGSEWVYELKWDGYRAIALKNGSEVELISRNQKSMTAEFPEVRDAIAQLPVETAVIDGEICALDSQGRPSFQMLQSRSLGQGRPTLCFYAFDLLQADARDWKKEELCDRKAALEKLLEGAPDELRFSAALEGDVQDLLAKVRQLGMEGVIGKQRASTYASGVRSSAWVKLKVASEQEFVIGGFTPPQGSRPHFGSLVVGYYEGKQLRFAGKVGTGFDHARLRMLHKTMKPMQIEKCPFVDLPKKSSGRWSQAMTPADMRQCIWVKPELVCQVRFAEWTNDGSLRQPVFLGLREDKAAREVIRERAK